MFGWGVLECGVIELVWFCIGNLPIFKFFVPTHRYSKQHIYIVGNTLASHLCSCIELTLYISMTEKLM